MVARIALFGIAVLFALSGTALACQATGAPQLDDNFKTPDPGWGRADDIGTFLANGLALTPPVDGSAWRINQKYAIGNGSWCVEAVNPAKTSMDDQSASDVGVWFWGRDSQNFYTATIALDGTAAVDRLVNGTWETVVEPTPSLGIKTAAGATNELEIVLRGNVGAFFVNGTKVADFRGQPPPGGGAPGVYGESGPSGTTWLFTRARLY